MADEAAQCNWWEVGCNLSELASNAATEALEAVAQGLANGAVAFLEMISTWWMNAPGPDLDNPAVASLQADMGYYIAAFAIIGFLFGLGRMVLSMDFKKIITAFAPIVTLIVVTGVYAVAIGALIAAGDGTAEWLLDRATDGDANLEVLASPVGDMGQNIGVFLIVSLLMFFGAIMNFLLMIFRDVGILVLLAFLPVVAASTGSVSGKQAFQKINSWMIALLLFKPVAAGIYALGLRMMTEDSEIEGLGGELQNYASAMTGMLILALAGLALPALIKFIAPAAAMGAAAFGGGAAIAGAATVAAGAAVIGASGGAAGGGGAAAGGGAGAAGAAGGGSAGAGAAGAGAAGGGSSGAAGGGGAAAGGGAGAAGAAGGGSAGAGAAGAGAAGGGSSGAAGGGAGQGAGASGSAGAGDGGSGGGAAGSTPGGATPADSEAGCDSAGGDGGSGESGAGDAAGGAESAGADGGGAAEGGSSGGGSAAGGASSGGPSGGGQGASTPAGASASGGGSDSSGGGSGGGSEGAGGSGGAGVDAGTPGGAESSGDSSDGHSGSGGGAAASGASQNTGSDSGSNTGKTRGSGAAKTQQLKNVIDTGTASGAQINDAVEGDDGESGA